MFYCSLCVQNFRGKVINPEGEAVEGVTIAIQSNGKKVTTNAKGNFSVTTIFPVSLVFTHINYQPLRVVITDPFSITVFKLARAPTVMYAVNAISPIYLYRTLLNSHK